MPIIEIGLNNEVLGINTYDVFVSECSPINWVQVEDDILFSQFPVNVDLDSYGIVGDCYAYLVSGDTGCSCQGQGWVASPTPTPTMTTTPSVTPTITPSITPTITTTPSITPTITTTPSVTPTSVTPSVTPTNTITPTITTTPTTTPTPTPLPCELVEISEFTPYDSTVNIFSIYQPSGGANQDVSICDWINCVSLNNAYSGAGGLLPYSGSCGIFLDPNETLPTESGVSLPIYYTGATPSDCVAHTNETFFGTGCTNNSNITSSAYVMISESTGTTIYEITSPDGEPSSELSISLYGTCDYYGGLDIVNGFNVTLNESNQWVINGEVNPTLNLICGQQYDFHICSSAATTEFYLANAFNEAGTDPANDWALGVSDGVTNNGENLGTISVTFNSDGTDGGYWYGQNQSLTNYGQINFVESCTGVTINNTNQVGLGYNLAFSYDLCDGGTGSLNIQGGSSTTINECIIPETITVTNQGPNANPSLWNYSGGDCCS